MDISSRPIMGVPCNSKKKMTYKIIFVRVNKKEISR